MKYLWPVLVFHLFVLTGTSSYGQTKNNQTINLGKNNSIILTTKDGKLSNEQLSTFKNWATGNNNILEKRQISKFSYLIRLADGSERKMMEDLREKFSEEFYVETDTKAFMQSGVLSRASDPSVRLNLVNETKIAWHPLMSFQIPFRRFGDVAHDYTEGDKRVGVLVADEALSPFELRYRDELGTVSTFYGDLYRANDSQYSIPSHGTMVSSVIFSQKNGSGFSGICPSCDRQFAGLDINIEKYYGDPSTLDIGIFTSRVIEAIDRLDPNITHVVNMSWGLPIYHQGIARALRDKHDQGIAFVAAVGNEDNLEAIFPANLEFVIGAGSYRNDPTTRKFVKSVFSNRGPDLVAPSETHIPSISAGKNSGRLEVSEARGTSFSAPQVTGTLGLLYSHALNSYPDALDSNNIVETRERALHALRQTAIDIDSSGYDVNTGYGIINAPAAIRYFDSFAMSPHPGSELSTITSIEKSSDNLISRYDQQLTDYAETRAHINEEFSIGSCWTPSFGMSDPVKVKSSKPEIVGRIDNLTKSADLLKNNLTRVQLSYMLHFSITVKLEIFTRWHCLLPFIPPIKTKFKIDFTPSGLFTSPAQGNPLTTQILDFELKDKYRLVNRRVDRIPHSFSYNLSGYLGSLNKILGGVIIDGIKSNIDTKYISLLENYIVPSFDQSMTRMIEEIYKNSNFINTDMALKYFNSRFESQSNSLMVDSLNLEASHQTTSYGVIQTQKRVPVHIPEISSNTSFPNLSLPFLPPAEHDLTSIDISSPVAQSTSTVIYGRMLRKIRESFDVADQDLKLLTKVNHDPFDYYIGNIKIFDNPVFTLLDPSRAEDDHLIREGNYAKIVTPISFTSSLNGGNVETVRLLLISPVKKNNIYRIHHDEFEVDSRSAFYEERLTLDDLNTKIHFLSCRICLETDPHISESDLRLVVNSRLVNEVHRYYHTLGALSVGKNADLGDHWGTMGVIDNFAKEYAEGLFEIDEIKGIDLNIGSFIPSSISETSTFLNNIRYEQQIIPFEKNNEFSRGIAPQVNLCTVGIVNPSGEDKFGAIATVEFYPQAPGLELSVGLFHKYPGSYEAKSKKVLIVDNPLTLRHLSNLIGSSKEDCNFGEVDQVINDPETRVVLIPKYNNFSNVSMGNLHKITSFSRTDDVLNIVEGCHPEININFSHSTNEFVQSTYRVSYNKKFAFTPVDRYSKDNFENDPSCLGFSGRTHFNSRFMGIPGSGIED